MRDLSDALVLAGTLGARAVSLTGLLPSATRYGLDLEAAVAGRAWPGPPGGAWPRLTTGHATTAASVLLALRRALAASGRELAGERVAFLGLGSIGASALHLMVRGGAQPKEILLCDVAGKRAQLDELARGLAAEYGFRGRVRVVTARGIEPPSELYDATAIGATRPPTASAYVGLCPA